MKLKDAPYKIPNYLYTNYIIIVLLFDHKVRPRARTGGTRSGASADLSAVIKRQQQRTAICGGCRGTLQLARIHWLNPFDTFRNDRKISKFDI